MQLTQFNQGKKCYEVSLVDSNFYFKPFTKKYLEAFSDKFLQ